MQPTRILTALIVLASPLTLIAGNKAEHEYNEQGIVISAISAHTDVYQIESKGILFSVNCEKAQQMEFRSPKCIYKGTEIAAGDKLQFRLDKDALYLPPTPGKQELELTILSTELKSPPAPPASADQGLVTATSQNLMNRGFASLAPRDASLPAGPVMVTPAGGGAPVLVSPTGPNNGGVMVGTPVTGGPPITGNQVGGPTANQVGAPPPPQWQHTLRLSTSGTTYTLACPGDVCQLEGKPIHPGDLLHFELDGKSVRLSPDGKFNKKDKFKVLNTAPTQPAVK